MNINIADKVVVITGASRGIGKELVMLFAEENAKVVINYHNSENEALELFSLVSNYNHNCTLIKADITNNNDVSELYHKTIQKYGRVDVLINNAGICDDNRIQLMSERQWHNVIETNLTGSFLCSRAFSKIMIKQKSGKIINIASLKGQEGCVGQVNYSASKAGLIGLTKSLAKELGVFNIAVNTVCPGFIVTDLNRHNKSKKMIAENRSLLNYNYTLKDLLHFILLLSSDRIQGISSQCFNLDSRV